MKIKLKELIKQHIVNNSKEYIFVTIIFLVGLFLGIMLINTTDIENQSKISEYILSYKEKISNSETHIANMENLKESIINNFELTVFMWFMGTTLIGIPIVILIILFKGACIGYTITSIAIAFGKWKGIAFILTSIFVQNIIFIPCILALGVSGLKLYKTIIKEKKKDNIKLEILRHTIFCLLILIMLILSSVLEIQISANVLQKVIKYF